MLYEIIELAKEHLTSDNRPCGTCAICLHNFDESDIFTRTDCYHYFHSHCLVRYAANHEAGQEEKEEVVGQTGDRSEEKTSKELPCPICRLPIPFLSGDFPPPSGVNCPEDATGGELALQAQKKMAPLYQMQLEKGGIIDVEAEKNKYLIEIANVPTRPSSASNEAEESSPPEKPAADEAQLNENAQVKDSPPKDSETKDTPSTKVTRNDTRPARGRGSYQNWNRRDNRPNNRRYQEDDRYRRYQQDDRPRRYQQDDRPRRYQQDDRTRRYQQDDRPRRYQQDDRNRRYQQDDRPRRYQNDDRNRRYQNDDRNRRYQYDDRPRKYQQDERKDEAKTLEDSQIKTKHDSEDESRTQDDDQLKNSSNTDLPEETTDADEQKIEERNDRRPGGYRGSGRYRGRPNYFGGRRGGRYRNDSQRSDTNGVDGPPSDDNIDDRRSSNRGMSQRRPFRGRSGYRRDADYDRRPYNQRRDYRNNGRENAEKDAGDSEEDRNRRPHKGRKRDDSSPEVREGEEKGAKSHQRPYRDDSSPEEIPPKDREDRNKSSKSRREDSSPKGDRDDRKGSVNNRKKNSQRRAHKRTDSSPEEVASTGNEDKAEGAKSQDHGDERRGDKGRRGHQTRHNRDEDSLENDDRRGDSKGQRGYQRRSKHDEDSPEMECAPEDHRSGDRRGDRKGGKGPQHRDMSEEVKDIDHSEKDGRRQRRYIRDDVSSEVKDSVEDHSDDQKDRRGPKRRHNRDDRPSEDLAEDVNDHKGRRGGPQRRHNRDDTSPEEESQVKSHRRPYREASPEESNDDRRPQRRDYNRGYNHPQPDHFRDDYRRGSRRPYGRRGGGYRGYSPEDRFQKRSFPPRRGRGGYRRFEEDRPAEQESVVDLVNPDQDGSVDQPPSADVTASKPFQDRRNRGYAAEGGYNRYDRYQRHDNNRYGDRRPNNYSQHHTNGSGDTTTTENQLSEQLQNSCTIDEPTKPDTSKEDTEVAATKRQVAGFGGKKVVYGLKAANPPPGFPKS